MLVMKNLKRQVFGLHGKYEIKNKKPEYYSENWQIIYKILKILFQTAFFRLPLLGKFRNIKNAI